MTDEHEAVLPAPKVRFILDTPADVDFFDTHTDVANAIVTAIKSNPEIKVIGLLGRWGSGKSTVAKTVMTLLDPQIDSEFRVFPYDAWLHQSDPLRRSFLESLIHFLIEANAISKSKWRAELNKLAEPVELTRTLETPSLAPWIALSLLGVPVGLGFLSLDTLKEAFGSHPTPLGGWTISISLTLVLLPLLTWVGIYLRRRPWPKFLDKSEGPLRKVFWRHLNAEGKPASALQIFVDGQAKQTTTQTFRALEPTSLEFGSKFQEIMREAVADGRRLIILIDNLDRVAEGEALGMWATIRSFFLADHRTEDATHESYHPTVILPIDRHAIEQLFAGSEKTNGRDRARSFMDKTFDVTFEVTEPVNSDWRAFWDQQMALMFGKAYQVQWGYRTRRLFESHLARVTNGTAASDLDASVIVTPREINKLLNRIGALYLQWEDAGIPIDVMALYVIRRDEIDHGLLTFLQQNDAGISAAAPEWKRQIAAVHYGVRVDKAAQVLLEEPIRQAIQRRDRTRIATMVAIPGFGEIFEFATANLPEPHGQKTSFDVLIDAALLLRDCQKEGEEWSATSWQNLLTRLIQVAPSSTPTLASIEVLKEFVGRTETHNRQTVLNECVALISRLLALPFKAASDDASLRSAAEHLIQFASSHNLRSPTFGLLMEPIDYLTRVGQLSASSLLRPCLRSNHDGETLRDALQDLLVAETAQHYAPAAVRAFILPDGEALYGGDNAINFEAVAHKANELVRNPESFGVAARPGILVLAELSFGRKEGREVLIALVDDGIIAARLNEAAGRSDWDEMAEIIAILMWRGQKFDAPSAFDWWDYSKRDSENLPKIIAALHRYFPSAIVRILWDSLSRNGAITSIFIEKLISHAVANDSLGKFDAKPVLAKLPSYMSALPYRLRDKFLEQVERQASFIEVLEQGVLGPQTLEVAGYLQRKGGEGATRAVEILRQRVESEDAAAWTAAIQSGKEPYTMGAGYIESGGQHFARKTAIFGALESTIPEMTNTGGRDMLNRWFILSALLNTRARNALLANLGRALCDAAPNQSLHVMKAGGVQFLKAGRFERDADRATNMIIAPQLDKKDGRTWLKENSEELAGWIQRSSPESRKTLTISLSVLLKSKIQERRYSADFLIHQWKLNQTRSE